MKLRHSISAVMALWLGASLFVFFPRAATAVIFQTKARNGKQIMCMQSGLIGGWEECGTENYVAVFRGKVKKVAQVSEWELNVTVAVEETFKGNPGPIVTFGTSEGICFDDLNEGSEWLFFLDKDEKTGEPYLNYYSRNLSGPVAANGEELARLRELKSSPDKGMIIGAVHNAAYDRPSNELSPLLNYRVVARNAKNGERHKAITDSKGNFSITQLPAGSYSLTPSGLAEFPRDLLKKSGLKIDVAPAGCYQVNLAADK